MPASVPVRPESGRSRISAVPPCLLPSRWTTPVPCGQLWNVGPAVRSALERFLQLAGDLVGGGLHRSLHDFGGFGKRLVESFLDGWLANRDEPCLVSGELLSRLVKLLAG